MASGSPLCARGGQTSLSSLGCVVGKEKKIETKGKMNRALREALNQTLHITCTIISLNFHHSPITALHCGL